VTDDILPIILQYISAEMLLGILLIGGFGPWIAKQLRSLVVGVGDLVTRAQSHDIRNISRERVDVAGKINDGLDHIRKQLGADRAYIFEFHNGAANSSGVPFLKLSNTYERCALGVSPQILYLQNLPIGVGYMFIRCLTLNEDIYLPDIEMLADRDPSTYMLLSNQGIKSLYAVGVFDFEGVPVGFVGVDFCSARRELSRDEANQLRGAAIKMCGLLLADDRRECILTNGGK